MKLEVKEPSTGALLHLEAKPERHYGLRGFRIVHPNGSSFFISNKSGTWEPADSHHIDPVFLINIGLALEHYDLKEQVGNVKPEDGETADD